MIFEKELEQSDRSCDCKGQRWVDKSQHMWSIADKTSLSEAVEFELSVFRGSWRASAAHHLLYPDIYSPPYTNRGSHTVLSLTIKALFHTVAHMCMSLIFLSYPFFQALSSDLFSFIFMPYLKTIPYLI